MKITDMSIEQLTEVFNHNKTVRDKMFDKAMDEADIYCGDYLSCWERTAADYSIGYDRGAYFRIKNGWAFIHGLEKLQYNYEFLADTYNDIIADCKYLLEQNDAEDGYEDELEEVLDKLEKACFKRLMSEYEAAFETETQLDYWWEYAEEEYGEYDCDIEHGDYTLRKVVTYTEELK